MSQRKEKYIRHIMRQYTAVAEDVDDLARRVGFMEARHRREDRLADVERRQAERKVKRDARRRAARSRRIAVLIIASVLLLFSLAMIAGDASGGASAMTAQPPLPVHVAAAVPVEAVSAGEDPMEAEQIEAALLAQGYFSDAVPLSYEMQDIMQTACAEYGCPYSLALAVAETESRFDPEAIGAVGEVGIMQLNPGPGGSYHAVLEKATGQDPVTPQGNIVCGVYLLGKYMAENNDPAKAAMAYNMGQGGAAAAWAAGVASTDYSAAVLEAMERWGAVVG